MMVRNLSVAAIAVSCTMALAHAAPNEAPASSGVAAYLHYAQVQAETLVGMTRVLSRAIKDNDLATAQLTYAPAHRFLERIQSAARIAYDLDKAMDARADDYAGKEADPRFTGFHRIEYSLFANGSTKGLSAITDRLETDTRALKARIDSLPATPATLLDATIENLQDLVGRELAGEGERYSKTDLWDMEAKVEDARQVAAIPQTRSPAREAKAADTIAVRFATIDALLEKHKEGCGFKSSDALTRDERLALEAAVTALAMELSARRAGLAID